jgi:hypothetical protein
VVKIHSIRERILKTEFLAVWFRSRRRERKSLRSGVGKKKRRSSCGKQEPRLEKVLKNLSS